jgi:hypothetical protein
MSEAKAPPRKRKRKKPASAPYKSSRTRELEAENAELRGLLGLDRKITLESWSLTLPQKLRDMFAARALMQEFGNDLNALQRLGFSVFQMQRDEQEKIITTVLRTPGVTEIIERDFVDSEASWVNAMRRMREIAIHGEETHAVRAAAFVGKVEGRLTETPVLPPQTITLYNIIGNQAGETRVETHVGSQSVPPIVNEHDPLAVLTYEPSEEGTVVEIGARPAPMNGES